MDKSTAQAVHERTFDLAERARLRRVLFHYMKQHKVRTSELCKRIAEATGRIRNSPDGANPYLVARRTLERFLNDERRTNDAFLIPIAQFAETLPGYSDPLDTLSDALEVFFRIDAFHSSAPAMQGWFEQKSTHEPAYLIQPASSPDPERMTRVAHMCVEPLQGRFALRVDVAPAPAEDIVPTDQIWTQVGHRSEGVMVAFDHFLFALLRDTVTNLPKVHWIQQTKDGTFYSRTSAAIPYDPVIADDQILQGLVYLTPLSLKPEPQAA